MKKLYVAGGIILGIAVTLSLGLTYLTQRHIDLVNAVIKKASRLVNSYHQVLLRRSTYLFATPEERYVMLHKACWAEVEDLLVEELVPIRETAEPRIDNYIKQVVYRNLQ